MHRKDKHNSAGKRLNAEEKRAKATTRLKKITVLLFFMLVAIYLILMIQGCNVAKTAHTPIGKEQLRFERRQGLRPDEQRKLTVFVFAVSSCVILVLNSREE